MDTQTEVDAQNRATSAKEVADFKAGIAQNGKPYFAYFKRDANSTCRIVTWMGDELGIVQRLSEPFRGGFGSRRRNFRMLGIDGRIYSGTYFESSGDYVRFKVTRA